MAGHNYGLEGHPCDCFPISSNYILVYVVKTVESFRGLNQLMAWRAKENVLEVQTSKKIQEECKAATNSNSCCI